ncbi:hypothetical protein [Ferroplasma sp.]|jgi:hypothetical protein|nr:hypothetical protein [Ferroplasma sp.]
MEFLDERNLDLVFQSKENRKIKVKGRWTTLNLSLSVTLIL